MSVYSSVVFISGMRFTAFTYLYLIIEM